MAKFNTQAEFEAYYKEKAEDGYIRGLCSSWVLSWGAECSHGKNEKGQSSCWFKKFGHPPKDQITKEMHAAVTARVQKRQAQKGKTQGGKGAGGKPPKGNGAKGKNGKQQNAWAPKHLYTDAEMKAWIDAGSPQ